MREYAIVRQNPGFNDMIALPFDQLFDLSNAAIEVIEGEWYENKTVSGNTATLTDNSLYDVFIAEISKYDYVLIPQAKDAGSQGAYSGLTAGAGEVFYPFINIAGASAQRYICGYVCSIVRPSELYLYSTQRKNVRLPAIGIILNSGGGAKNADDDMRSDEIPVPDPDDVKGEPAEPEPETRSTKKK